MLLSYTEQLANTSSLSARFEKLAFARKASQKLGTAKSVCQKVLNFLNHQLSGKKVFWKLKIPYAILREYNEKISEAQAACGGRSGAFNITNFSKSMEWSNLLNEVRTYFEQNSNETNT